ncbi:unnamed protein product [Tenebrio molitor]|nr:unnamed protein product [Tenebrio molitor]
MTTWNFQCNNFFEFPINNSVPVALLQQCTSEILLP